MLPNSKFMLATISNTYTGIGAITWEEVNIQATRAALRMAPRYILPVSWKNQVEMGMTMQSTTMMWNRFRTKETNMPPGPTSGIKPVTKRGTY